MIRLPRQHSTDAECISMSPIRDAERNIDWLNCFCYWLLGFAGIVLVIRGDN